MMTYLKIVLVVFFCITLTIADESESCAGCSMERRKPMRYGKRADYPIDWKSIGSSINNERYQKMFLVPVRKSFSDQFRVKNNPNSYYSSTDLKRYNVDLNDI